MTNENSNSLEETVQNKNNSKDGHSMLALPVMAAGLLVGTVTSAVTGFKLAQGKAIDFHEAKLVEESVCMVLTSLAGASFCSKKRELLYAPAVYAGVQIIAGLAGYGAGYFLR